MPLEAAALQTPGLMLETANLASPSPSIQGGARGPGSGAYGLDAGLGTESSSSIGVQGLGVQAAALVGFYVEAEGPIASYQVDPQGSLYTRGQELTRLEFACVW